MTDCWVCSGDPTVCRCPDVEDWPAPSVDMAHCWVCRRQWDRCHCPPCHRPPWAVISAHQAGAAIGRRAVVNHDPRRPLPGVPDRLLYATKVEHPEAVQPGVDPTFIEVGTRDSQWLLNPISDILVELTADEYTTVRYHRCGPAMSCARWHPPRVDLEVTWPMQVPDNGTSDTFQAIRTEVGDQFILPI